MEDLWLQSPHRRWNPLRHDWVVVSPQRTQRPWQGQIESNITSTALQHDPTCYLCPGNMRASGVKTPNYETTDVFENDYAALRTGLPRATIDIGSEGLLKAETELGICRVLCFNSRHDLTLATMGTEVIRELVDLWIGQARELGALEEIRYVQIFENRGSMMGASNPHPHGQIWATEHVPNEPQAELQGQSEYFAKHGEPLLSAYLRIELEQQERIVAENDTWVALVPFWATWPFETLLLPRSSFRSFNTMSDIQKDGLADILKRLSAGYDRVFDAPFPYSMGFHPAPCDGEEYPGWTTHAHFYPPLLRSATVRKFMVGFELLGSPQRDITPESAADVLRKVVNLK